MSVTANDFLLFAQRCLEENTEIGFRNCISRSYYACYHSIAPLLKNAPVGHTKFINYLCNANETYQEDLPYSTLRKCGLLLDKIYPNRVISDYKLDKKIDLYLAKKEFISAKKFIEDLHSLQK